MKTIFKDGCRQSSVFMSITDKKKTTAAAKVSSFTSSIICCISGIEDSKLRRHNTIMAYNTTDTAEFQR